MTKNEYMASLRKLLKRLPAEDFKKAMDYYEEYFADAGPENEAQAIEDLGSPESAAEQIITELALNNAEEPAQGIKKGLSAVWIGILALFAAPIALPLILAVVLCILAMVTVVLAFIAAFFILAVVLVIIAPVTVAAGFTVLISNPAAFITCLGIGAAFLGTGLLLGYACIKLCRAFLTLVIKLFGRIVKKGEVRK